MKYLNYLLFRLGAKNVHGVHSPFVYDFVTKCLNQPASVDENVHVEHLKATLEELQWPKKFALMLLRVLHYFNFTQIVRVVSSDFNKKEIEKVFNGFVPVGVKSFMEVLTEDKDYNNEKKAILYFFDEKKVENQTKMYFEGLIEKMSENDVLLVEKGNLNNQNVDFLIRKQDLHLTIDMFYFFLFFKRSQQRKEHFKLKF